MFDCHFHIDPELVDPQGLLASMDRHGIDRVALIARVNPAFQMPRTGQVLMPVYRRLLHAHSNCLGHRLGLKIYQGGVTDHGEFDVLGRKYPIMMQPDNEELIQWLSHSPERFVGFLFLNPENLDDPRTIIERYQDHPQIIGVKLHPYWHRYSLAMAEDIADLCQSRGWVILAHLGVADLDAYRNLPQRFPGVNFIYCHGGVPFLHDVCAFAGTHPNVYVDLSGSSFIDRRAAAQALSLAGPRKCLFGSDGPLFHSSNKQYNFSVMQNILLQQKLPKDSWHDVTYGNFSRLLGPRQNLNY